MTSKNRRKHALLAAALTAWGAWGFASPVRAETLNLLIWESYIDESVLRDFTAETGIQVRQSYFDSSDARDEVLGDPGNNVDVALAGENGAKLFGGKGYFLPLTTANVPSLVNYESDWVRRCGSYALPYLYGTMGILYRSDRIPAPPTSWKDLLSPQDSLKGHVVMHRDHHEAFVPALVLAGRSINSNDTNDLQAAFELMKGQSPHVLTYDYVITSIQHPDIGPRTYIALGYSGDQHVLNEKAGTDDLWRYVVPKEGTLFWLDCLAVNARSERKDLALRFLDFIGRPENAARVAVSLKMPSPNKGARAFIPAAMLTDAEIYPPEDILARSQPQYELSVQSVQARRRIIGSMVKGRVAR